MITAFIDGDWILYAAGFAGQKNELVCPLGFGNAVFKNITEIRKAWKEDGGDNAALPLPPTYSRFVLDEESHFYHSAKSMIERSVTRIADKFNTECIPIVMIDGDGNFRSRIAKIKPYKGTRSVHAKPLMYNSIRQYMLDHHAAVVIHGEETDDAMAIMQTELIAAKQHSIIVSIDKDMLQVAGWHHNPNKGFKLITANVGLRWLYTQGIMGDSTDNIGGAYKYGPVAAKKIIAGCDNEKAMWHATLTAYQTSINKHGYELYNGLDAYDAAVENMRLVYLRRKPLELWMPPGERE